MVSPAPQHMHRYQLNVTIIVLGAALGIANVSETSASHTVIADMRHHKVCPKACVLRSQYLCHQKMLTLQTSAPMTHCITTLQHNAVCKELQ